jgi:hypothetical protein
MNALLPLRLFAALLPALAIQGQDILHYKFESGGGATEINYGDINPGIPRLAEIVPHPTVQASQAWTAGKFGTGLAAAPGPSLEGFEVDTGWDNVVGTGVDLTIALFFKTIHPVNPNFGALFCGPASNGAGILMGLSPTTGHPALKWSHDGVSTNNSIGLAQNLLTPSFSNWVHLAVVVNRSGSTTCQTAIAQWFVNGVPQTPQATSGCLHDIAGTALNTVRIGDRNEACCAIDDFRLYLRAASAAEILQWATSDIAADVPFGDACHPFGLPVLLWGSGGLPVPGNGGYKLTAYGLPGSSVFLALGFSNTSFAGSPLPADLGTVISSLAGCQFRTGADVIITTSIGSLGSVDVPLPIPLLAALVGVDGYAQAVFYSPVLAAWSSTNAWALHVGN